MRPKHSYPSKLKEAFAGHTSDTIQIIERLLDMCPKTRITAKAVSFSVCIYFNIY
jgi:hypothetical protein